MAKEDRSRPIIPAVAGLTDKVLGALGATYEKQIAVLEAELSKHDIETIFSRVRSLSKGDRQLKGS